jgi:hypothetical protein
LQVLQLGSQDAKLRPQVPDERRVAEGVVRLSRTHDHAFHLAEKALDDGPAVFFPLKSGKMNGKLASQL